MKQYTAAILGALSQPPATGVAAVTGAKEISVPSKTRDVNYTATDYALRFGSYQLPGTDGNILGNRQSNMGDYSFGGGVGEKAKDVAPTEANATQEAFDVNQWMSANNMIDTAKYSKEQIKNFASGVISLMQSVNNIYNGYIAQDQYAMEAANKEFQAEQNKRAAELLRKNIKDIDRAAQADANVYRLEGVKTKSAQRVGQAASGFAVGKGVHQVMLDTTDARTNYNASMIMLRAGLQNAEILRQAGTLEAQAILDSFDAKALKAQGELAKNQGWLNGMMNAISGAADFYVGTDGFGASGNKASNTGAKNGGNV